MDTLKKQYRLTFKCAYCHDKHVEHCTGADLHNVIDAMLHEDVRVLLIEDEALAMEADAVAAERRVPPAMPFGAAYAQVEGDTIRFYREDGQLVAEGGVNPGETVEEFGNTASDRALNHLVAKLRRAWGRRS